jgi:hypothetical protein
MEPIISSAAALSVAIIFYAHRAYLDVLARRHRLLRQRVAFMLWSIAADGEQSAGVLSA